MGRAHTLRYIHFLGDAKQEKMPVKPLAPEAKRNALQTQSSPEFLGNQEAVSGTSCRDSFGRGPSWALQRTYQFQALVWNQDWKGEAWNTVKCDKAGLVQGVHAV